jgi:hypothetical protein
VRTETGLLVLSLCFLGIDRIQRKAANPGKTGT